MLTQIFAVAFATLGTITAVRGLTCNKGDGIYEYTCFYYNECKSGSVVRTNCSRTEVFDPTKSKCVTPVKGYWPCQDAKDCLHSANSRYADFKAGCNTYYTCYNGYFYGHNYCPGGLVFDEAAQLCNWKRNVGPPCGSLSVVG